MSGWIQAAMQQNTIVIVIGSGNGSNPFKVTPSSFLGLISLFKDKSTKMSSCTV